MTVTPKPQGRAQPRRRAGQGRWLLVWAAYGLVLLLAPWLFSGSLALGMLTQMGYLIIICLSYNMLFGQGGMLSFGHAVYVGLGAFLAIHVLNLVGSGAFSLPVSLLPLVGGLGGAGVAALLGWITTRRAGTSFAMITLGIGELVAAASLMFPAVFGGEGGISTDRVIGQPFLGISFAPDIEVYYLVAVYCFVCTALMFAFTRTPLGLVLNAVRENPLRLACLGLNPQYVRYLAFVIAGFFAGTGGALMVLHFETITAADSLNAARSGSYLLFTFVGGATVFFGPVIGAVLMVLSMVLLSALTQAWLLYLGLLFILLVMFAPGGVAGIVVANAKLVAAGRFKPLLRPYLLLLPAAAFFVAAFATLLEMLYHLQLDAIMDPHLHFLGLQLDVSRAGHWWLAAAWLAISGAAFEWVRRRFSRAWKSQQALALADTGGVLREGGR